MAVATVAVPGRVAAGPVRSGATRHRAYNHHHQRIHVDLAFDMDACVVWRHPQSIRSLCRLTLQFLDYSSDGFLFQRLIVHIPGTHFLGWGTVS